MNAPMKVGLAVGGGYLLGRTKKLRLAITVGSLLAGRRIPTNPRALLQQGLDYVDGNPELSALADQIRGELYDAARGAAIAAASSRMDRLSDSLSDRALSLESGARSLTGDEGRRDQGDEGRSEPGPQKAPARKKAPAGKKAPARKKAPAKAKAAANKAPASSRASASRR